MEFRFDDNDTSNRRLEALMWLAIWQHDGKISFGWYRTWGSHCNQSRSDTSRRDLQYRLWLNSTRSCTNSHGVEIIVDEPEKLLCRLYHSMAYCKEMWRSSSRGWRDCESVRSTSWMLPKSENLSWDTGYNVVVLYLFFDRKGGTSRRRRETRMRRKLMKV